MLTHALCKPKKIKQQCGITFELQQVFYIVEIKQKHNIYTNSSICITTRQLHLYYDSFTCIVFVVRLLRLYYNCCTCIIMTVSFVLRLFICTANKGEHQLSSASNKCSFQIIYLITTVCNNVYF